MSIERRKKFIPAIIKKSQGDGDYFVKPIERDVKVLSADKHHDGHQIVESRTVFSNNTSKKYVTTCYLKQKTVPCWYTESLVLDLESKKKTFDEKVFYMNKLQPSHWSESMTTDIKHHPGETFSADLLIPVSETGTHYISLEPQQMAAVVN